MAGNKPLQMTFSIVECKCTEFNFTDFAKTSSTPIPVDKYLFNFTIGVHIKAPEKKVTIDFNVILQNNSDIKETLANLKSTHTFVITNIDDIVMTINNQSALPDASLIPLIAIAASNVRGMFSIKLEDSIYSNAIMPLLDAAKLMPPKMPTYVG